MPSRQCIGIAVQLKKVTDLLRYSLGLCYSTGKGVVEDEEQAGDVVPPCSRGGLHRCSVQLGRLLRKLVKGSPRMQSWPVRGTAMQQRQATQMLSLTWAFAPLKATELSQDAEQAVFWYRRAAEAGHAEAQFNLGLCFSSGDGVDKDAGQAVSSGIACS